MLRYDKPILILLSMLMAVFTLFIMDRISPIKLSSGSRNKGIDGLRGYLAFLVFTHHSYVWYHFIHFDEWILPSNYIFANAGQIPVIIFFMITAYLFIGKISALKYIDWKVIYESRLFRIYPLYIFSLIIAFAIVGMETGFELRVPATDLLLSALSWMTFSAFYKGPVNTFANTGYIYSGVYWTLVYEWVFYLSLPLVAFLMKKSVGIIYLVIALFSCAIFISIELNPIYIFAFAFGGLAVYAKDIITISRFAETKVASLMCLLCLSFVFVVFYQSVGVIQISIIGISFILIVSGTNIFGLLNLRVSRIFGEISYSVYLMHGLVIYIIIEMAMGSEIVKSLSSKEYSVLIIGMSPIVVIASFLTYKFIEKPFIDIGHKRQKEKK